MAHAEDGGEPGSAEATQPQVAVGDTEPAAPPSAAETDRDVPAPGAPPAPGSKLGRFAVLHVLGQGGMGVVVAAHDPDLDRDVAIKLLRPSALGLGSSGEARARLLREARAMARLSHPNVLVVHEVGTVGEEIFVATELVAGGTLRAWLKRPRPWRDVLARFLQAGRGLLAAHDAGLVHRDFKPDNVLLASGGEVRVADFGLVSVGASSAGPPSGPLDDTLTQTGSIIGTPGYMAPEQHLGQPAGQAADQFAFCVSLWEGLYGQRPFAGATYPELAGHVTAGAVRAPPAGSRVPPRLAEVLRRGLRVRPEERWPSMRELLEALSAEPPPRRSRPRRRLAIAGAALLFAGGLTWMWAALGRHAPAGPQCRGFERRLQGVWDAPRRAAVRAAFLGTATPYAADTFARVARLLDQRAAAWVAARGRACAATYVRGDQSVALLERRMRCLDDRLGEIDALVRLFARAPDVRVLDSAINAVAHLPALDRCSDLTALQRQPAPPTDPAQVARAIDLERRRADAEMLEADGKYAEALPIAHAAVEGARALGYTPLYADALLTLGTLQEDNGDARGAEASYRATGAAARMAGDARVAARAATALLSLIAKDPARRTELPGLRSNAELAVKDAGRPPVLDAALLTALGNAAAGQGHPDEAARLHARALALRERALGPDDLDVALSLNNLAVALDEQGKMKEAAADHERALAIREKVLGPEHPDVAVTLNNLGAALYGRGDLADAERYFKRALAIREKIFGLTRAETAESLDNLGSVVQGQGRYREAERLFRRALAIREKVFGPEHPITARTLNNLANALEAAGRLDEALRLHRRAIAIRERVLGDASAATASSYNNLGDVLFSLGRYAQSRDAYQRALDIWTRALGPHHYYVGVALLNLGGAEDALGRHTESLAFYQRALALLRKALGDEHPLCATALVGVATGRLALGRAREAVAPAERALALRAGTASPAQVAEARFVLARALWASGGDRRRARELASAARAGFAGAPQLRPQLKELDTWLGRHGKGGVHSAP